MKKVKLRKRKSVSSLKRVSELIPVETENGNKAILKATVISVDPKDIKKNESNEITDESAYNMSAGRKIIPPPLNQYELSILNEYSSELGQILQSMVVGVEGFGQRLVLRDMSDEDKEKFKDEINKEKKWLQTNLIDLPCYDKNFTQLREEILTDLETTGNAYVELIPPSIKKVNRAKEAEDSDHNVYSSYNKLQTSEMLIVQKDKKFTKVVSKYLDDDYAVRDKIFYTKLRRYVQSVNGKIVYFKEYGDSRIIDKESGEVKDENWPQEKRANEVLHLKLYTARKSPYGLPRYTGNIIGIKGSRSADESNILTQQNNNVPSMAILVSGGMLTKDSIDRVQEFVDKSIKGDLNYSKFLVLEGESMHDGLSNASSMKVEIKPLINNQHTDALWQEYDKRNADKTRRNFRLPAIMTGDTENLNRATAQESERLAEKYVYNPIREKLDCVWNKVILQQGFRFWIVKTNSPNVTNDEDLVKILNGAEKSGGLTPRISRMILEDILNRDLPPIEENDPFFNPDIPFSLSLAKLTQGLGLANQEGTMAPQGQMPKPSLPNGRPPEDNDDDESEEGEENEQDKNDLVVQIFNSIDPAKILNRILTVGKKEKAIKTLIDLRDSIEETLNLDTFGKEDINDVDA